MISPAIGKAIIAGAASAFGAATAGANGVDLSHLDIGQWAAALGTGLVSFGALLHNPKGKEAVEVDAILEKAVKAKEDLTKQTLESLKEIVAALPANDPAPTAAPQAVIIDRRES